MNKGKGNDSYYVFYYPTVLSTEGSIVWESDGDTRSVTPHRVLLTCPPSETSSVVTSTPCRTRASSTSGKPSSTEVSWLNSIQAVTILQANLKRAPLDVIVQCWSIASFFFKCLMCPKTPSVSPCELHCRPLNEHFSEKMRDAVTDGTPCYEGNKSRDMCINGICKVSTRHLLYHIFSDK